MSLPYPIPTQSLPILNRPVQLGYGARTFELGIRDLGIPTWPGTDLSVTLSQSSCLSLRKLKGSAAGPKQQGSTALEPRPLLLAGLP